MRKAMVAGNWKMNGARAENLSLVTEVVHQRNAFANVEVAVCPPFVYLADTSTQLANSGIGLGAQNLSDQDAGAYTGEVSGAMLTDVGCRYVIVGHSERRALYGEDDAAVAAKVQAALRHGLTPILCVGETLEEREGGITETVVARQLDAVIDAIGVASLAKTVIAYEPVWAIGTGKTATPEQAQAVHEFIRERVADADAAVAEGLQVLYGGSVKPDNASELFAQKDIDGGLIGGASLDAASFVAICKAAG